MVAERHDLDDQLLDRLRSGDERALDALIARYHSPLNHLVRRYVGSGDAADDVLQDVFVRIWRTRHTLVLHGSLRSYLYAAARNAAVNAVTSETARRRREALVSESDALAVEPIADAVEQAELEIAVRRALDDLPERCREVFLLCRQHGLSYPEVASALGVSLSTVKTQMGRAMAALARRLTPFLAVVLTTRS